MNKDPRPQIKISRGRVGRSNRNVDLEGVKDAEISSDAIGRDEDNIRIHAGAGFPEHPALDEAVAAAITNEALEHDTSGININIAKGHVGRDESEIKVVVNKFNIGIAPQFQNLVRPWDQRHDTVGVETRNVFVATQDAVLEFEPEESSSAIRYKTEYTFTEKIRRIRSLTPLDVAGEVVLLVGCRRRVGAWQPLEGNRSELGFYRVPVDDSVRGGFNSVTVLGEHIYGAHSELGLIRWDMSAPDRPITIPLEAAAPTTRPGIKRCIRGIKTMSDGTLFIIYNHTLLNLIAGDASRVVARYSCPKISVRRCMSMDPQSRRYNTCRCGHCLGKSIGPLSDFIVLDNHIFAISENGLLIKYNRTNTESGHVIRNFGAFCFSMRLAELFGGRYLVIGTGFGVHLVPVDDGQPEYFYSYPQGIVNHAFAGSDRIIAEADDLKTLLVWDAGRPGSEPDQIIRLKDQYRKRGQSISVLFGSGE